MTDNRFAHCNTPYGVLWAYRKVQTPDANDLVDLVDLADALARIRELTPPAKPVVSEEAQERARIALRRCMNAHNAHLDVFIADAVDRIIDALGYTTRRELLAAMTAEAADDDCYSRVNGFVDTRPPPVVALTADYMRMLADALTTWTELVNTIGINDVAIPVSHWGQIVWHDGLDGPGEWVLRIGGGQ